MKKRILALLTLSCVLLSGCAAMLEQDYIHVSPHSSTLLDTNDPSILRVETYQELVNALIYFISAGTETGTIRLYLDSTQIETDLENACLEVIHEDPLGAYAVEYIKYSVTPLVTYSEAEVQITYRRSREQLLSIVSATGTPAIRSELESVLSGHASSCTLRIGYFDQDEAYIQSLVRQAYLSAPSHALDYPDATVSIYPENSQGRQRIVEIELQYHLSQEELLQRETLLQDALHQNLTPLLVSSSPADIQTVAQLLLSLESYHPDGGPTAYHTLVEHRANSEGLALCQLLLCESLKLPCHLVSGSLHDTPHYWNIVETTDGWRHLDLSSGSESAFLTDEEQIQAGYLWDPTAVPACPSPEPVSAPS